MQRASLFFLFTCLALCARCAVANDARALIKAMSDAFSSQNYDGIFVYSRDNRVVTMRILHANIEGVDYERLIPLDGKNYEILKIGREITYAYPKNDIPLISSEALNRYSRARFSRELGRLEYYDVNEENKERVAGRLAIKLTLSPKDKNRYAYQIWLDNESKLLLKSLMLDHKQRILERFQFTQLTLKPAIDKEQFAIDIGDAQLLTDQIEEESSKTIDVESDAWDFKWLPPGYELIVLQSAEDGATKFGEMRTYSDGLSAFSVFIDAKNQEKLTYGIVQKGATSAVTMPIAKAGNQYTITVVGEIPLETAKKIAQSVTKKTKND